MTIYKYEKINHSSDIHSTPLPFAGVMLLKTPVNGKTVMHLMGKMGLGEPKKHAT
jgi:hypothetical protein